MAHYAYLDENNIVTMVIVGRDENDAPGNWEEYYGAKRTSYNTRGGIYYDPVTNEPAQDQSKAFRKNYAGAGFTYDAARDAFIPPKPYLSWVLNDIKCLWEAPVPYPTDGKVYYWDETTQTWVLNEN
jgi:hypothetical protein